jgi:hypothetical protein
VYKEMRGCANQGQSEGSRDGDASDHVSLSIALPRALSFALNTCILRSHALSLVKLYIKSPDVWSVLAFPSSYPAQLRIDSSSPTRKRRRMSSPTYDDQLAFPSQDELRVIGQFEISLSQAPSRYRESGSTVPGMGTSSQNSFGLEVRTIHTRFTTLR